MKMYNRNIHSLLVEMQTLENKWADFYKLNILLSYVSTIMILVIYTNEFKTCPHKNLHTKINHV